MNQHNHIHITILHSCVCVCYSKLMQQKTNIKKKFNPTNTQWGMPFPHLTVQQTLEFRLNLTRLVFQVFPPNPPKTTPDPPPTRTKTNQPTISNLLYKHNSISSSIIQTLAAYPIKTQPQNTSSSSSSHIHSYIFI